MTRRFFGGLGPLTHTTPQRHSSTRDVSVTPVRREPPAYVIDHGTDALPLLADAEREQMAQKVREHMKKLYPGRVLTDIQASG